MDPDKESRQKEEELKKHEELQKFKDDVDSGLRRRTRIRLNKKNVGTRRIFSNSIPAKKKRKQKPVKQKRKSLKRKR
jgi:hypothetical protein